MMMVLIACGTPAARRWLPQAVALVIDFLRCFVEWKTLVVRALSFVNDGDKA